MIHKKSWNFIKLMETAPNYIVYIQETRKILTHMRGQRIKTSKKDKSSGSQQRNKRSNEEQNGPFKIEKENKEIYHWKDTIAQGQ